ncbi:MAG TPA: hypothetical protein VE825_11905, partial [Terriglobales bacterium]|nr:hypothetical protein [Terriglobales bacterium]
MSRRLGLGLCCFLLLAAGVGALPARGGGPRSAPSGATLQQLGRHAGFIFRGRVLSVDRPKPARGSVTTVQITFQVLEGIRGVRTGERLTTREWAGLWGAGRPRYRVGQEMLLFLYPRSRLGLTSPVSGDLGVLPIDAAGQVLPPATPQPGPGAGPSERPPRVPYREFS